MTSAESKGRGEMGGGLFPVWELPSAADEWLGEGKGNLMRFAGAPSDLVITEKGLHFGAVC